MLKNCWVKKRNVMTLVVLTYIHQISLRSASRYIIHVNIREKSTHKNIKHTSNPRIHHLIHVSSTLLLSISVRVLYLYIFISATFNLPWVISTHKSINGGWRMFLISNLISPVVPKISRHAISPIKRRILNLVLEVNISLYNRQHNV